MIKQELNGQWQLEIPGYAPAAGEKLPVSIPGSVYSGLLENGKMEDPFWRDNELKALEIMENDFIFTRELSISPEMEDCEQVLLICEGLDTICDIELDGRTIGSTENMHRTWEYDLTKELGVSNVGQGLCSCRELKLTFHSPTKAIAERFAKLYTDGSREAMRGYTQLRKAHCMFGWDWGPRLPDAGIWRDIYLVGMKKGEQRIDSVYITQKHENGNVELTFNVKCKVKNVTFVCGHDNSNSKFQIFNPQLSITVTAPDGKTYKSDGEPIMIDDPELWWPNGYGAQPLYSVKAEVIGDVWERKIGLRTLTVKREKDEWGESFAFTVNGLPIFAMGADYIPQDNLLSRATPDKIRAILDDCIAANYNCIRVWGGGIYPGDAFFDACDELGLIVWQDFMFACGIYELTPEFEDNIRNEFIDNIKRIRHHASLGLWCGNNEMEWQYCNNTFKTTPKQYADYIRIFGYIMPRILQEYDPETFFWPASPSSGGDFDEPNDEDRGNVHCWDVWHGMEPFSYYRKHYFRFCSEFGFQSFPDIKTVRAFTEENDRNIFSRIMEMHQRNTSANGKIMTYMAGMYRYPHDFELLLYASQLLQADAVRYGVEHWRRNRGRCMGAIYWQVNDIWPVASWASIDYFGRWKALHYYAKRFFAPVMLSCCETGEMTERPSPVSQREPIKKAAQPALSNETGNKVSGTVSWALRDEKANIIKSGEMPVHADAYSSVWLDELDFSDCDELSNYFSYELVTDKYADSSEKGLATSGTVLFCMPKHFNFADPALQVTRNGNKVTVSAQAYAKSVEIYSDTEDFVLSDNFFDLNADSVTVEIVRGYVKDIKVRSVYDIR